MPILIDKAGNRYPYQLLVEHEDSITLDGDRIIQGKRSDFSINDGSPICITPIEFKLLWTSAERIAARSIQETDSIIADFFDILDDARLTIVNLSLGSTQDGIDYLLSKLVDAGVIAAEDVPARRASILSGKFV
ncbi:MAG: hypothetical protein AB7F61_14405 [Desulfobulbus sp.]